MAAIFRMVPYWALARFGRWDQVLAEPAPPSSSPFLQGSWHYVRGLAFVAKRQIEGAERELGALGAGSIAHILETRRRQRGQRPVLPVVLPNHPGVRDLDLTPPRLETYDALSRRDDDPDR